MTNEPGREQEIRAAGKHPGQSDQQKQKGQQEGGHKAGDFGQGKQQGQKSTPPNEGDDEQTQSEKGGQRGAKARQ
jgi:hypothetical protein